MKKKNLKPKYTDFLFNLDTVCEKLRQGVHDTALALEMVYKRFDSESKILNKNFVEVEKRLKKLEKKQ